MRKLFLNLIAFVATIIILSIWISGISLHLYTILVAYKVSGFISALIALSLPFITQVYWVIKMWHITDHFINGYSFYVFIYIVYFIIAMTLIFIGNIFTSWKPKEKS